MLPEPHEFWIDYNLPPKMAKWLTDEFNVVAKAFKDLNFETTPDAMVYKLAAKKENIIVITTKDIDFKYLQGKIDNPPKILYLNIGNISNVDLHKLITSKFSEVLKMLSNPSNILIEITNT